MNMATAVPQLDAEFFDEGGLPKVYNLPPAPQIGSMNILKKVPQNNAILVSERGEEIQPIEQLKQPNNTPSVPGSVPTSDFSQIEFPLTEVVNQSQIDFSSIADTLDSRESNNSLKEAPPSTDLPLKSKEIQASDEEITNFRDLTISAKPPQSTRDSCTIATSINSTLKKSFQEPTLTNLTGLQLHQSKNGMKFLSTRREKDVSVKPLKVLQDSLPDPIHFIEKGFQSKTASSTQRKGEDMKDTAFQLIQKIHNQLQPVQWDLQRLHSIHKYEF